MFPVSRGCAVLRERRARMRLAVFGRAAVPVAAGAAAAVASASERAAGRAAGTGAGFAAGAAASAPRTAARPTTSTEPAESAAFAHLRMPNARCVAPPFPSAHALRHGTLIRADLHAACAY